jgi:hypothetical protein
MRGQRVPKRIGNGFRGGLSMLAVVCVAGCVPPPVVYSYPPASYVVSREPPPLPLPRKPTSLTGGLPGLRQACANRPDLTEADKAKLFRQFEDWQKDGSLPAPERQAADIRPPCAASAETP